MFKDSINLGQDGLSVLFVCGVHGNESKAVKVVMKLREMINEKKEKFPGISTIGFMIGVNKMGLKHNAREWIDEPTSPTNDMNRAFERETKVFDKCFDEVVDEIKEKAKVYDVVIDVHNSPNCIESFLIDFGMPKSNWLAGFAKDMEKGILQPIVRQSGVDSLKNYVNSLSGTDHLHVGFTVELGGMGFEGEHCDGEENIKLKAFKLIQFMKELPKFQNCKEENIDYLDCTIPVLSSREGIIEYTKKNPNTSYKKDEEIGVIISFTGTILERIKAPCDGVMIGVSDSYYVDKFIGEFQPFTKPEIFDKI